MCELKQSVLDGMKTKPELIIILPMSCEIDNDPFRSCHRFLEAYKEYDVDFWALTGGNEPMVGRFENWAWQCMFFSPELQRDFIKLNMGPTLAERGHGDVKIIILDDQRAELPHWAQVVRATIII